VSEMEDRLAYTILTELDEQIEEYIVPMEDFLKFVSSETGWSEEQLLLEKDIGDVEKKLQLKAKRPIDSKALKRGKSSNNLYKFVSNEKRHQTMKFFDKSVANK